MDEILQMFDPLETRASLILRLPNAADVAAWDEFVAIYAPLVYRLARRKGLQPADADDLVQEVLTAVSTSVEGWLTNSERGPFRAWLFRIARNTVINFLTRAKYRTLGQGGDHISAELSEYPTTEDARADFEAHYQRQVFRWASVQLRDKLADKTWRAFWETTMEDRPIAEVAGELEMTVGSVYIARSRVMSRLRDLVQRFEERDG